MRVYVGGGFESGSRLPRYESRPISGFGDQDSIAERVLSKDLSALKRLDGCFDIPRQRLGQICRSLTCPTAFSEPWHSTRRY